MAIPKVLRTGQIAAYCGVTPMTVISWIQKGRLRGHQLPGRGDRRVKAGDFLMFLRKNGLPMPDGLHDKPPRVLIVEDEVIVAVSIREKLEQAGFRTEIALDAFSAGSLLETFDPNVLTLDLKMPGIGGLAVLRFVRQRKSVHDPKVLVVSAMEKREIDKAMEAGADEYILKPFNHADLVARVSRLVNAEKAVAKNAP